MSQYRKGKTNLDFTEARDSEWQWHQLGHMQVCTSHQTDNHASTPPLSIKALKVKSNKLQSLSFMGPGVIWKSNLVKHYLCGKVADLV